ncbi:MAG: AAA family ATPase, partial [Gammaproteobacteria bacterium]
MPEKLVDAGLQMEMFGSVGTIGRAICMADPGVNVVVVGGWAEIDPKRLVPELNPPSGWSRSFIKKNQIKFRRAVKSPFTRVITRVYARREPGKDEYLKRYDKEVLDSKDDADPNFRWPVSSAIDVVIVGDYNKGFLLQKGVVKALKNYGGKPFILRAKRKLDHHVIKELPWTLLCPNRQDFADLLSYERPIQTVLRKVADQWSCHPDVLKGLHELSANLGGRTILLKLDREGALLLNKGNLTAFPLAKASQGEWAGIGAGDTLMATLAVELSKAPKAPPEDAVAKAVKAATAYSRVGSNLRRWPGWCGTTTGTEKEEVDQIQFDSEPRALLLKTALRDWRAASSYPQLVKREQLVIEDAAWYLHGFLTVDKKLGPDLRRLKYQIQDYLGLEHHARPFATAICGGPGSGKSSLVKALADELGCARILENAAQWTDVGQLFRACEEVRTKVLERKQALVLIDEVDSEVASEPLYAKLLAPLWDGSYQLGG